MKYIFNQLKYFLILAGAASLYLNFANPKVAKESLSAITKTASKNLVMPAGGPAAKPQPQRELADPETLGRRYVKIDGKLYEYNPRNTYNINGQMMMYKNGNPKTMEQLQDEHAALQAQIQKQADSAYGTGQAKVGAGHQPAGKVVDMLQNNPAAVYTPGGVKALMDGAREAAAAVDQRNKALNDLQKE